VDAARQVETSGQSFGLSAARRIAELLDLYLKVSQSDTDLREFPGHYPTTFSIQLAKT
jgi:hypothetical protein